MSAIEKDQFDSNYIDLEEVSKNLRISSQSLEKILAEYGPSMDLRHESDPSKVKASSLPVIGRIVKMDRQLQALRYGMAEAQNLIKNQSSRIDHLEKMILNQNKEVDQFEKKWGKQLDRVENQLEYLEDEVVEPLLEVKHWINKGKIKHS